MIDSTCVRKLSLCGVEGLIFTRESLKAKNTDGKKASGKINNRLNKNEDFSLKSTLALLLDKHKHGIII